MQFIPFPEAISIRSDRLILRTAYEEIPLQKSKSAAQEANEANLRFNAPAGHINRKIRMRMSRIIYNWIESVKVAAYAGRNTLNRQFTFVTLTLPAEQMHSDKDLNKLALNPFIIKLTRKHGLINYLWRAERQENGNLHYHIIADTYIHHAALRAAWNGILDGLGYIDKYRQNQKLFHSTGFRLHHDKLPKWSADKQLKAYHKGVSEDWSNPNSTDIHSLKNVKDAAKYISKYCTKSDLTDELQKLQECQVQGMLSEQQYNELSAPILAKIEASKINSRVWGCSDAIKKLNDPKILECAEMYQLVSDIETDSMTKVIVKDDVRIYYCKNLQNHLRKIPLLYNHCRKHYLKQYQLIYNLRIEKPPQIDISFFQHPEPEPALTVWKPFQISAF